MTGEREFDALLRSWFEDSAPPGQPQGLLESVVTATAHARPRPGWLVRLRGEPMPETGHPGLNRFAPLALVATALVVALLIGIGLLVRSPNIGPSPLPGPTHDATPGPTDGASAAWVTAGNMREARTRHTATLLANGKVLVAGGGNGSGELASAELYDPMDGSWTSAGNMIRGRVDHTATLLRDGRVLVVGGLGTGGPLQVEHSAELYDPATGSWSATGRVNDPFVDHTATLLRDGSVLVAGGGSAQLYDPASGTWRATGKMIEQRYFHTATLLPDGRVLVAGGGCCVADRSLVSAEIYDPGSRTWIAAGRMIESRMYHKAMLLSDGNVLITGGSDGSKSGTPPIALASPELYDPIRGTWTATGEMRAVRCCLPTFTLLADGTVLAAGGIGQSGGLLASAELYDSSSGTWTATVNMHQARAGQTATLLLNGTVLVAGGDNGLVDSSGKPPIPVTSAELYDPGSGT